MWALLGCVGMALGGCATSAESSGSVSRDAAGAERAQAAGFFDLGPHSRRISTASAEAQRWFDQGLVWAYAFNHDEAERAFRRAAELDPRCPMPWWGIALVNGPHINNPVMDMPRSQRAWDALERAHQRRDHGTEVERGLIDALGSRYRWPDPPLAPADRAPLDRAYADAMRGLHAKFPSDGDIATLYAEALMDLRPWDLWAADGTPRPETPEITRVLEGVLAADPRHPGANHLYIHAVEASRHPERAQAAADRLRTLVPDSGHLTHMPSHIDVRTGRWAHASDANDRALQADARYRARAPKPDFYHVYMLHNKHFLAYSSMMEGRRADAIAAARAAVASAPADWSTANAAAIDGYMPIALEALMRFGRWEEILREPAPPAHWPITTAFWRFTRGVAHAALGDVSAAREEQRRFRAAVDAVSPDAVMAINNARTVLSIAEHMLEGEIAYREGRVDDAVASLRKAVPIEDGLLYMEPPDWVQPVRHTLGAVLLKAGRAGEAEAVYREDLERWPENGWSLLGLSQCLRGRGGPEAADLERRLAQAWARADVKPTATCLCVTPD